MTSPDVRELARAGRVQRHPRYHAHEKGFAFLFLVQALAQCHSVVADERRDSVAALRHPNGWLGFCPAPRGRLRIDFELLAAPTGDVLLIVTAMSLEAGSR